MAQSADLALGGLLFQTESGNEDGQTQKKKNEKESEKEAEDPPRLTLRDIRIYSDLLDLPGEKTIDLALVKGLTHYTGANDDRVTNFNDMIDEIGLILNKFTLIATQMLDDPGRREEGMAVLECILDGNSRFYQGFGNQMSERMGKPLTFREIYRLKKWRERLIGETKSGETIEYFYEGAWKRGITIMFEWDQNEETDEKKTEPIIDSKYPGSSLTISLHSLDPRDNQPLPPLNGPLNANQTSMPDSEQMIELDELKIDLTQGTLAWNSICPDTFKSRQRYPRISKWRKELRRGSHVDVLDSVHKWYTCTVLAHNPGEKTIFINYDGWSHRYDEWVPADALRLQPYKSYARGGRTDGGVYGVLSDIPVVVEDDSRDPSKYHAIWRGSYIQNSFYLIDNLNIFGQNHGFHHLFFKFEDKNPSEITIPDMACHLQLFTQSSLSLSKKVYSRLHNFITKKLLKGWLAIPFHSSWFKNAMEHEKNQLRSICHSLWFILRRYKIDGPRVFSVLDEFERRLKERIQESRVENACKKWFYNGDPSRASLFIPRDVMGLLKKFTLDSRFYEQLTMADLIKNVTMVFEPHSGDPRPAIHIDFRSSDPDGAIGKWMKSKVVIPHTNRGDWKSDRMKISPMHGVEIDLPWNEMPFHLMAGPNEVSALIGTRLLDVEIGSTVLICPRMIGMTDWIEAEVTDMTVAEIEDEDEDENEEEDGDESSGEESKPKSIRRIKGQVKCQIASMGVDYWVHLNDTSEIALPP